MSEEVLMPWILAGGMTLGLIALSGWILLTWLKMRHGYPLETSFGETIEPQAAVEARERMKLLSTENAELRAELGSLKDRVATLERIVTDDGHRLTHEIERLRAPRTEG